MNRNNFKMYKASLSAISSESQPSLGMSSHPYTNYLQKELRLEKLPQNSYLSFEDRITLHDRNQEQAADSSPFAGHKEDRSSLSSNILNSSLRLPVACPRSDVVLTGDETLFDTIGPAPVQKQNFSSTLFHKYSNCNFKMESPRKREVFAEKEQLTIEAENLEMLRKRIAEDVAENERRDEPSSKSRRKSAKPTKIFVEEEDEEEIIEEIFIDTDPLTPSCDDFATTPRIVKPKSGEENGEKESMEFSDRLDIHKIKHYDNCIENDGEIIPLSNIDLERLHKGTQNHLLHRKKEIHVKLKNSPESPILSPLSLLQRSMPQTTNVVATVNVKTVSNNNAPVLQQKLSQPQVIPQNLDEIREKAVAIKSCMELTSNEIEQLILGGLVVKVSNRKKPDQSLKYSCKFCIWYSRETNGQVKLRSFGRKEEIKRHHMLHLRYERFQCQYCPYKVVRSDHLHRHMKNKHPEVNHPGPQSTRSKRAQLEYGDTASPLLDFPPTMVNTHNRPSSTPQIPNMQNDFLNLIQNATNGAPNPAQLIQSFLHFQRLAQNIPQTAQVAEEPETAEITVESDNEEESTISGSS